MTGTLPTDWQFTGQRNQSILRLYDYHARFYDPALGRFVQADTIVPEPGNPQDFNRLSYSRNNPLKYIDPDGHAEIAFIGGSDASNWWDRLRTAVEYRYELYLRARLWMDENYDRYGEIPWDQLDPEVQQILLLGNWTPELHNVESVHGNAVDVSGTLEDPAVWLVASIGVLKLGPAALSELEIRGCTSDDAYDKGFVPGSREHHPPGWNEDWEWREGSRRGSSERWWDPEGGEWRWHSPDEWHPKGHWDYNPWEAWNDQWRNADEDGNLVP